MWLESIPTWSFNFVSYLLLESSVHMLLGVRSFVTLFNFESQRNQWLCDFVRAENIHVGLQIPFASVWRRRDQHSRLNALNESQFRVYKDGGVIGNRGHVKWQAKLVEDCALKTRGLGDVDRYHQHYLFPTDTFPAFYNGIQAASCHSPVTNARFYKPQVSMAISLTSLCSRCSLSQNFQDF